MSRLVLTNELLTRLRKDTLTGDLETCAVLFGRTVLVAGKLTRIVVRESIYPTPESYILRTGTRAILRAEFVADICQRARRNSESAIFVHTHPFPMNEFSQLDDAGEEALSALFRQRVPAARHAAMLLTPERSIARELGTTIPLRVAGIGTELTIHGDEASHGLNSRFDRQVRAFGQRGQAKLRTLRVGIVGLGGTGTLVLQSLTYLGIQDFLLIDPDTVEESNLNRLVGATPSDIGEAKVVVAAEWAKRINPAVQVTTQEDSILKSSVALALSDCDFGFCCTDSHGSRAVLNQLAYQYLIPIIDMGVVIAISHGQITHIAGRTQLLAPGIACLTCGNLLDPEQVRRDLLSDFERQTDPYIIGDNQPAPAVISINSTIASLAITMFLNTVIGIPGSVRFVNYDAITGASRPAICTPHSSCVVCSLHGALARANEWPLPARQG